MGPRTPIYILRFKNIQVKNFLLTFVEMKDKSNLRSGLYGVVEKATFWDGINSHPYGI